VRQTIATPDHWDIEEEAGIMAQKYYLLGGLAAALMLFLLPETSVAQRLQGRIGNRVRGRPETTVYYYVRPGPVYYARPVDRSWYYPPSDDDTRTYSRDERPTFPPAPAPIEESVAPVANRPVREADTSATVNLELPAADAEVWVQGKKLDGSGTTRRFVSPPLDSGDKYTYTFQGRWLRDGREVKDSRSVEVYAGDRVTLDFTRPEPGNRATEIVPREYREPGR